MKEDMVNIKPIATGKNYWRSLEQLAGTAGFREWLHREFPVGASEMLEDKSRRTLLKLMGASFGLAGLAACRRPVDNIFPMSKGIEDYVPGKPYYYSTAFSNGGPASGLIVETHDGRPTKIEGNPDHPFSLGAASAFAQASLLDLYDPDRSSGVLENGRGSSWDAFATAARATFQGGKLGQGEGLRFLSGAVVSSSYDAVRAHVLQKYPLAKWVEFEPVNNDPALQAAALAFSQPLEPLVRFDKADVVLSLDSDFLGLDSPTVQPVKQFSKRRRVKSVEDTMNRLYVVESQYSITGAMADHRLRMRASGVPRFAAQLLSAVQGFPVVGGAKWLNAVARDLKANRGKCAVVAGPRQDVSTHLLAFALNELLGNLGETVTYVNTGRRPMLPGLLELASEMSRGAVNTLVILGGNPVFTAPADTAFAANLKKVALSIHVGQDADETASAVNWHVPEAHYLESWGDGRSPDGTATIQQPMIEPLHGGKTQAEVLAFLGGYKDQRPYDIVRNHFGLSDAKWRKAVHDGLVEGTSFAELKPVVNKQTLAEHGKPRPDAGGLEVVFVPSSSAYDGRFTNNGWMQEAPDPMTKLVWGNAALMSDATAKTLGVGDGDMVAIRNGALTVDFPAMVQPGHADQSITLSLGYGREKCGRVGTGIGYNAHALRGSTGFQIATGVTVLKTGKTEVLATTQQHHTMEGRPIVREATLVEYRKKPGFADEMVEHEPLKSLYPEVTYTTGNQWGMSIDLSACIGCNACLVACQAENNIPIVGRDQVIRGREMHWIRMDRYYTGDISDPEVVTQPLACQQCENAPCENVCPVVATTHSPEGLNDMAYNRCVGTRYCANNCPYKVRRFNFLNFHKNDTDVGKLVFNPDVTVRMRGVMEKCNYCVQRIQETKIAAKADGHRAIRDGEIQSACQQTCPADAIVFGNINDPASRVAKLKKQERDYALLAELDVKPRTTYLAKLRNPNPELNANG